MIDEDSIKILNVVFSIRLVKSDFYFLCFLEF